MRNKLIKLLGGLTQEEFKRKTREYEKEVNETTLARKQLGSIDLSLKWLDELEKRERKNILSEADDIFSKDSFNRICSEMENRQILHIAREAQSFNEMNFGRGTLNGISLIKDEIAELASLNRQENQEDEKFDKYNLIN